MTILLKLSTRGARLQRGSALVNAARARGLPRVNVNTRASLVAPRVSSVAAGSSFSYSTSTPQLQQLLSQQLPPVLAPPEQSLPQPLDPPPAKSFFKSQYDKYSFSGQQSRIRMAESFFEAATRQAEDPRWFGPGRISRDFRHRHALLTMHLWFLHKRLISDGFDKDTALMVQEEFFNILWDDTTCRIRKAGVPEIAVNKNLMQVQQYTFLHLVSYDEAFTAFLDKPEERMKELRKIVWQHIFVRDPEMEHADAALDRIAWYIEANYQNIMVDWPDQWYRESRVAWVDLPDFSGATDASGKLLDENPVHEDDVLPTPWKRNITIRGVEYYWNPVTMEATWDRPLYPE